jgi:hypothetical protein
MRPSSAQGKALGTDVATPPPRSRVLKGRPSTPRPLLPGKATRCRGSPLQGSGRFGGAGLRTTPGFHPGLRRDVPLALWMSIEDAALLSPGQGPGDRCRHATCQRRRGRGCPREQGKALGTDVATPSPASQSPERTPLDASAPDAREGNEAARIAPSGLWEVWGGWSPDDPRVSPWAKERRAVGTLELRPPLQVRECDLCPPQGFTLGSGGTCRWHLAVFWGTSFLHYAGCGACRWPW